MAESVVSRPQKAETDVTAIFKRTEVIGRGKFGVVYKGYHVKTKQVYAIKVLNLDSDADEVDDVQREIQFLSSMKQIPNITHYYGSYLKDTRLWIIIEYCAGGSLRTLLRPGKLDEKYIGVIMRELLTALKCIHKDNVIHRDIKAANVLISNEGQVKLCDFGVAAQLNQTSARRQTMAGTPYWMAPEVIMEGVYYDTKVDIWSLGITTYEVATGNPPYCQVEALRAMQLITKSKPPRLEGRNYSTLLKEFIALCLDEDPKERLSADDLLKTKFIKAHRTTPASILKQLISRYLLFREKNKSARESAFLIEDEGNPNVNGNSGKETTGNNNNSSAGQAVEVDVKWDFDSLSSSDYIMENDINPEEIPEGSTHDWTSTQSEKFNFAYPDEDQYYYYPTNNYNNGGKVYQGTTIAKNQPTIYNSTLNAPLSHNNTIGNQLSKRVKATYSNTTTGTNSYSTANKKTEARAPKMLLELFEENAVINEGQDDSNFSRINKNLTHLHLGPVSEDISSPPISDGNLARPHAGVMNNTSLHSQSTPALPLLQTKFSISSKGPKSSITAAPTPIEIEIPEELPISTATPHSINEKASSSQTKPRSSTLVANSGLHYKPPPGISRRLTLGNTASREVSNSNFREEDETYKGTTFNNFDSSKLNSVSTSSIPTKQHALKSPSPSKIFFSHNSSPTRKPGGSPNHNNSNNNMMGLSSGNDAIPPPSMKPVATYFESKDVLLQPLNNSNSTSATTTNSNAVSNTNISDGNYGSEKEVSRVNRDFKRNNPNLKLHMPLPTTIAPNKLLDTTVISTNPISGPAPSSNENINQFGFNTSTANIPISMTPINEKHVELGAGLNLGNTSGSGTKPKRVHSISNRKNSQSTEPFGSTPGSITTSNSINNVPTTATMSTIAANSVNSNNGANTLPLSNSNVMSSVVTPAVTNSLSLMPAPPSSLNMDFFIDLDPKSFEPHKWVDHKPQVLQDLNLLLKMFEDGLPVVKNALERQLHSSDAIPDRDQS